MIGYTKTVLVSSNDAHKIARVAKQSKKAKAGLYEKFSDTYDYYDYIHDIHFGSHNTYGDCADTRRVRNHHSRNQIYTTCKATDMSDVQNDYLTLKLPMRYKTHPSFSKSIKPKLHARSPPETIFEESDQDFVSDDYVNICDSCRTKKLVRDEIKTYKDSFTNTLSDNRDRFTETVMHNNAPDREYPPYYKHSVMPVYDEGLLEKEIPFKYSKYSAEKEFPYPDRSKQYSSDNERSYGDNLKEYPFLDDHGFEAPNADLIRYSNAETQTRKDSECNTDMPVKDYNEVDLIHRALEKETPIYRDVNPSKRPQQLKSRIVPLVDKGTDLPDLEEEEPDPKNPKTRYMLLLKNIDGSIEEAIEISKAARKVLYNEGISDVIVDKFVETKPLEIIKKDAETTAKKKKKVPLAAKLYKSVKSRYNSQNYVKNDMKCVVERQSTTARRKGNNGTICVKQCMHPQEFSRPPRRMLSSVKQIDPELRYRYLAPR